MAIFNLLLLLHSLPVWADGLDPGIEHASTQEGVHPGTTYQPPHEWLNGWSLLLLLAFETIKSNFAVRVNI